MENTIEVARSYSQTIQLKHFEPINSFCSLKATASPEDVARVAKELYEQCKAIVEADIERQLAERDAKPKEHKGTTKIWGTMRCPTCKNPRKNCQCDEDPSIVSQEVIQDLNKQDKEEKSYEEVAVSAHELI